MDKQAELEGQVALLTGGAGDIGRAIAASLLEAGARVSLSDLREPDAAAESDSHPRAAFSQVDTTQADAIEAWLDETEARWGPPTIAVANAAIVTPKSLREIAADEWRRELDVNLTGAFLMANAAARRMAQRGVAGKIILIGSWAAEKAHPHVPAYSVAKAGLRMLCKLIAAEYAAEGIQAIEVAPGYVEAGLSAQVFKADPERARAARARVPLKRLIVPQEVAHVVRQLCHPSNRHMTGCSVTLDGGLSL